MVVSFNRPGFKKSLGLGYADSVQNLRFCTVKSAIHALFKDICVVLPRISVLHPSTPRCYNTFSRLRDILDIKFVPFLTL
jgi:hypothetical protein